MFSAFNSVEMALYGYKSKCSVLKFWALMHPYVAFSFPSFNVAVNGVSLGVLLCFQIDGKLLPLVKIKDHF